jgi:hypothetical protein
MADERGERPDHGEPAGPGGFLELPLVVIDEVVRAVPRLVDRTRSQAELARRVATHLPCIGGLFAPPADVPVPAHEASQPADVLTVVALRDDEDDEPSATVTPIRTTTPEPQLPPRDLPAESDLPVPDYDSLAASQVVPRLASLSADELVAVGTYERAHRNRQTILNKVAQLQAR